MDSDTACYMFFPTLYMAVVIEETKENKYLDTGDFLMKISTVIPYLLEWEMSEKTRITFIISDTARYMFFPTLYMVVVIEEIEQKTNI